MARWRLNHLAGSTFERLAGVKALIEHSERSIPILEHQATTALKNKAESEGWDFEDYDLARQELEGQYEHWLPKYAGYSAVILLASIVETQLKECANQVAKDKSFPIDVDDIKGSSLEAPAFLIKKLTGVNAKDDIAWRDLMDLQQARNIIVHRAGARGASSEEQEKFDKLNLRAKSFGTPTDTFSNKELRISMQYCLTSVSIIEEFFKRLFGKLGLPVEWITFEP